MAHDSARQGANEQAELDSICTPPKGWTRMAWRVMCSMHVAPVDGIARAHRVRRSANHAVASSERVARIG
jgi:hypothetical protein